MLWALHCESERGEIPVVLSPKVHPSATSKQNCSGSVSLGKGQFRSHRKKSQNRDAAVGAGLGFAPGLLFHNLMEENLYEYEGISTTLD